MTKKAFKEQCNSQTYVGWNGRKIRINAFFFDYKSGSIGDKYFGGYKFMVSANVNTMSKAELFNEFYQWVVNGIAPSTVIKVKFADTDEKRFKISLQM